MFWRLHSANVFLRFVNKKPGFQACRLAARLEALEQMKIELSTFRAATSIKPAET